MDSHQHQPQPTPETDTDANSNTDPLSHLSQAHSVTNTHSHACQEPFQQEYAYQPPHPVQTSSGTKKATKGCRASTAGVKSPSSSPNTIHYLPRQHHPAHPDRVSQSLPACVESGQGVLAYIEYISGTRGFSSMYRLRNTVYNSSQSFLDAFT
jgi:hypothetical protein